MIKVGSKEFNKLPIDRRIRLLVERGWKQAAFKSAANAGKFARLWKGRGYNVRTMRSSGPTIEDGKIRVKAYYVMASK